MSKAAFSKGYQSTGFVACCLRYGDFAVANRFKCPVPDPVAIVLVTPNLLFSQVVGTVVLLVIKYGTLAVAILPARVVLNISLPTSGTVTPWHIYGAN